MALPKFVSFWVCFFWCFLWPKLAKNHAVSKIRVFLHLDMLEFCSVGELSCRGCELEIECQIAYPSVTGKVRNLWKSELILVNFGMHRPHIVQIRMFSMLGAGQKAHLLLSFLCKVLRRKDSLPFPREKIDSGVFVA